MSIAGITIEKDEAQLFYICITLTAFFYPCQKYLSEFFVKKWVFCLENDLIILQLFFIPNQTIHLVVHWRTNLYLLSRIFSLPYCFQKYVLLGLNFQILIKGL